MNGKITSGVLVLLVITIYLPQVAFGVVLQPTDITINITEDGSQEFAFKIITELNESSATISDNCLFPLAYTTNFPDIPVFQNVFFTITNEKFLEDGEYACRIFVQTEVEQDSVFLQISKDTNALAVIDDVIMESEFGETTIISLHIKGGSESSIINVFSKNVQIPPFFEFDFPIPYKPTPVSGWENFTVEYTVTVQSTKQTSNFEVAILKVDSTPPEVILIGETDAEVLTPYKLLLSITDNENIEKVNATFYRGNRSEPMSIKHPEEGKSVYEFVVTPVEYGTSLAEIEIYDKVGNKQTFKHSIFIDYVEDFIFDDVEITQAKINLLTSRRFFTSPAPLDVQVTLTEFNYYPDDTYSNLTADNFTIYFDYDGRRSPPIVVGQPIKLIESFNLTFSFVGAYEGNIDGKLLLSLPSQTGSVEDEELSITGRISDFNVPEPFDGKVRGTQMECNAFVKESLEESEYVCVTHYPIDVSPETFDVIGTPLLLELERENLDEKIQNYKDITGEAVGVRNASLGLTGIFGVLIFWLAFIRGKFMIQI